jgi:hypothetical protein
MTMIIRFDNSFCCLEFSQIRLHEVPDTGHVPIFKRGSGDTQCAGSLERADINL